MASWRPACSRPWCPCTTPDRASRRARVERRPHERPCSTSATSPSRRTCRCRSKRVEPWHGHFTTVAEAPDAGAAIAKFQRLLRRLGGSEMFGGVSKVYRDLCVEVRSVPARGFLAHFSSKAGEDLGGISTSVVGAKPSEATAFDLGPDHDIEEEQHCEPFIVLAHGPRLVPPAARRGRAADGHERR